MKSKEDKKQIIEQLRRELEAASNAFLFDFRGIAVGRFTELRQKIRETDSGYQVVKNTLITRAVEGTDKAPMTEDLEGMTAVAYTHNDPVALTKVLTTFAKENPTFTFKTGMVEGRVVTADQLKEIASLPGREQLLSKLVFLLQSPIRRLATVLAGPTRNLAVVLSQIKVQKDN